MTLPLSCACGARLEIDEKFAGQEISCPDCQRSLSVPPLPKPPSTTSGLALASFLLALIGAFTIVGTLAAMVCGFLALRAIERSPQPLGGKYLARAGLIMGGVFMLLTVAAFFTMERFGLDGLLRSLELAGSIEYGDVMTLHTNSPTGGGFAMERPSLAWGKLKSSNTAAPDGGDNLQDLTLFNVWEDAQIVCLGKWFDRKMPLETCRQEGLAMFQNCRLVKMLARVPQQAPPPPVGDMRELRQLADSDIQEFYLDLRLGGIDRTFLVRVLRDGSQIYVVAGGARKKRFGKLEEQLQAAVEKFKPEK
jgi:hypothetical protein